MLLLMDLVAKTNSLEMGAGQRVATCFNGEYDHNKDNTDVLLPAKFDNEAKDIKVLMP